MINRILAGIVLFVATSSNVFAVNIDQANVDAFIDMMVTEHAYDRDALENILGEAKFQEKIIEQISKPAERPERRFPVDSFIATSAMNMEIIVKSRYFFKNSELSGLRPIAGRV